MNAAVAMAILDLISHVHLPSFVNTLPKYLKRSTFFSCPVGGKNWRISFIAIFMYGSIPQFRRSVKATMCEERSRSVVYTLKWSPALDLINFESKCTLSHQPLEFQHTNNTAPLSADTEVYFVFCDTLRKKEIVFNIWNHSLGKKMTTKKVAANCQHLAAITEAQSKYYVFRHCYFFKLSLILTF